LVRIVKFIQVLVNDTNGIINSGKFSSIYDDLYLGVTFLETQGI